MKNKTLTKPKERVASPSVNITRDAGMELTYFPTTNAKKVYNQIISNYPSNVRSFSIIGAYGTGKSAILLALDRHLNGKQDYFGPKAKAMSHVKGYKMLGLVGKAK